MIDLYTKFKKTYPNAALLTLVLELEKELRSCDSVLDLGCGSDSPLKFVKKKEFSVGVDGHKPSVNQSKKKGIHDKYYVSNILSLNKEFNRKSFDAVIALDVVEHLEKKDGLKFIKLMESLAKKRVIILTPNGFISQHNSDNNLQEHLSGWSIKELKKLGYKVRGMYGWKPLRIEEASLRFKPKIFWGLISELTHYFYTSKNPSRAFSLLAVKRIK